MNQPSALTVPWCSARLVVVQEMLAGEAKLIGNGNIRDVYLVERDGRTLVVKALRDDFELRATKRRADMIHRWEAAALDAVSGNSNRQTHAHPVFPRLFCFAKSPTSGS